MTEEVKKLFNAPWKLKHDYSCVYRVGKKHENEDWSEVFDILDKKENEHYARFYDKKVAKRFMHLPELYEALKQAVYDCCEDCLCALDEFNDGEYECDENGCVKYDLIEKGCIFKERDCCPKCRSWIDILRKVRDGK